MSGEISRRLIDEVLFAKPMRKKNPTEKVRIIREYLDDEEIGMFLQYMQETEAEYKSVEEALVGFASDLETKADLFRAISD